MNLAGAPEKAFEEALPSALNVLAAYGVVHIMATDLGLPISTWQRNMVLTLPVEVLLLYATAWTTTGGHKTAAATVLLYLAAKYAAPRFLPASRPAA